MASESLWNYYREDVNNTDNENNADNYRINSAKTTTSNSSEYKTKIIREISISLIILNAEVVGSLKNLSNFWRSFDLPLINCKIELDMTSSINCILS